MMRAPWMLGMAFALAGVGCGRTPFTYADEEETTDAGSETGDPTTRGETTDRPEPTPPDPGTTTSDTGDDTSATGDDTGVFLDVGEVPTCRDILMCALDCLLGGGLDFQCITDCGAGAPPEETAAAIDLIQCVFGGCVADGKCEFSGGGLSQDCLTCVGIGLFVPVPPGCEDQAAACQ